MHKQGRGGEALGISLICGVIGGLIGLIFLVCLTEPLAKVALVFTPPAYFALGILGISVIASLSEGRSEEHTSELQSLMRISYAVFCLKKKKNNKKNTDIQITITIDTHALMFNNNNIQQYKQ